MPKSNQKRAVKSVRDDPVATKRQRLFLVSPKDRIAEDIAHLAHPVDGLIFDPNNAVKHSQRNIEAIMESLCLYGQMKPIVVRKQTRVVMAGNGTLEAAKRLGWTVIAASFSAMTDDEARDYGIADNRTSDFHTWDEEVLARLVILKAGTKERVDGWTHEEIVAQLAVPPEREDTSWKLQERFVVPPFTVLDSRQGYWQERKQAWLSLGIKSELGRGATTYNSGAPGTLSAQFRGGVGTPSQDKTEQSGTSVFDPVICELAYTWFCPRDGVVLDPFAGGSVRGVAAARLGRKYVGVELRPEQAVANELQAGEITLGSDGVTSSTPRWVIGDAVDSDVLCPGRYDFIFSCPPYGDLEVYSDDPRDLSNMPWSDFLGVYQLIVSVVCGMLKKDRFVCWVVGDFRDPAGNYRNFIGETIRCFLANGLTLHNEAILVTAVGSLPIRVGSQFTTSRKLGKTHQNVLVFLKGDAKEAVKACGPVDPWLPTRYEGE